MSELVENETQENCLSIQRLEKTGLVGLAEIFHGHRQRLRRMVDLRMDHRVAGRVDASDVLQDTYLDASRQLEQYLARPPMSLFVWLRFLTGQRLMAIHRHHLGASKRDAKQEEPWQRGPSIDADSMALSCSLLGRLTSPSMAAMRGEMQTRLQELVENLDPLDRDILALRHYEELTNLEAAEELNITPAAASKRYIRALVRLKSALTRAPELLDYA
jgi:RNA polymerase sigma-70 factor (ECF subfamily)